MVEAKGPEGETAMRSHFGSTHFSPDSVVGNCKDAQQGRVVQEDPVQDPRQGQLEE